MTGKERMTHILHHEKADRIGLYEHFWGDTNKGWKEKGWIPENAELEALFPFDMRELWAFNYTADLDFKPKILSETHDTYTALDGNGAILKRHKFHDTTPEHIGFTVQDREGWDRIKDKLVNIDLRRINFEGYRQAREKAAREERFFVWSGINVFECMHPVCGHEYLLMGMLDDPDWILDMADTYATLTLKLQEILFEKEGWPDGIWYYEDMGYKGSPFMSPRHYRELIQPSHAKTIGWAHAHNLPVIMHSCGFVEPLLGDMIDAGIDCLQVIEVKAGMDPLRIQKNYGDKIALMGGIDVRALYSNDRAVIDRELESKIPILKEGGNFTLHSDHSIPCTVDYDTYRYFIEKGFELGRY